MSNDAWCGRGGLGLVCGLVLGTVACAPPCYDDGVLQGGGDCPKESGSAGSSGPTTGSSTTQTTGAEGTGESGVMTASGSGQVADSSTGEIDCPGLDELLTPETRTFELVVEQTSNMANDLDGVSHYDAVADALFDPMDGVVSQHFDTRFGMVVYRGLQASCPQTESEPPQVNAAGPLAALMAMNPALGINVLGDSFDAAVTELEADMAAGDKTIVLFLGSEPATCAIQNPANAIQLATTRMAALDAVTAAYDAGFPTLVISVGANADSGFVQQLANEGIGHQAGDPDALFWEVLDREELRMAMAEITAGPERPCDFSIADPISDELAPACEVVVNGAVVMYEDPDGWDLPDPQTLQLQGAACDSIQSGLASISMTCACDA